MTELECESGSAGSTAASQGWEAVLADQALLANLRHELRTPLNAIIGYSEMLLEDAEDRGPEEFIPDLQKIHTAGKELLALVNETLDPAKIKAGNPDVDLETIGANLDFQLRTRLNAIIGYSEILLEDTKHGELEDSVLDLQKIHAAAKRFLALISDLSAITGGVPDSGQGGTADTSALIDHAMATVGSLEDKVSVVPAKRCLVLVVDDNDMNRDVLSRHLERQGHAVAVAENGRQALEMIKARSFDLVLLDIMMPEMDGYQVLQRLKADDSWRDIPVIVISALDEIDSVVRCIEMGAEDYLPKPFDPVLLRARTSACLEKKRLRDMEVEYLRDVAQVTSAAVDVEVGAYEPGSLANIARRADELGQLARVFERMAREVYAREEQLKQQLQQLSIQLDESKQARRVAEITDTDYFQQLEAKAQDLRKIIDGA